MLKGDERHEPDDGGIPGELSREGADRGEPGPTGGGAGEPAARRASPTSVRAGEAPREGTSRRLAGHPPHPVACARLARAPAGESRLTPRRVPVIPSSSIDRRCVLPTSTGTPDRGKRRRL